MVCVLNAKSPDYFSGLFPFYNKIYSVLIYSTKIFLKKNLLNLNIILIFSSIYNIINANDLHLYLVMHYCLKIFLKAIILPNYKTGGSFVKRFFSIVLLINFSIFFLFGMGCSKGSQTADVKDGKISVYTSFYTMYDFTKKIGGDRINLTNLVPTGTEPHDWEPKAKDMSNLENADVFIVNGSGMEVWADKIVKSLKNKKLIILEASKGVDLMEGGDDDHKEVNKESEHNFDPHVWLNPLNAKKQMEAIKDVLTTADPDNKDYYEKNYAENSKLIDALDKEYKDAVAKFTRKEIVVAHQAFGYLCDAYGLKQVAIEGLNAESEPTAARMAEIARFARENKVNTIFFEELVNPKVANAIAKEIGAKTEMLNPLEGISEEGLKAGKEYFSVMRDNLNALKKALQ